ncbi:MAG: leucine-rich repeat domain-containing protein [Sedimentisphaerales bacterium]|nr:leucine-rich repeat domain-containing protein [Sedimentisphaerales bacterium]
MINNEMEHEKIMEESFIQKHKRLITIISILIIAIATINIAFIIKTEIQRMINAKKCRLYDALQNLHIKPVDFFEDNYTKVTYISCRYESSFSDLDILRKFTNLQTLKLDHIRVREKYIPKWKIVLAKFGIIKIDKSRLLDLGPIGDLKKLQTLSLVGISFRNAEILKNLTNLKELNLFRTNISDLEPLKALTNLQTLDIKDCKNITDEQVEDLQKALPNLKIIR